MIVRPDGETVPGEGAEVLPEGGAEAVPTDPETTTTPTTPETTTPPESEIPLPDLTAPVP